MAISISDGRTTAGWNRQGGRTYSLILRVESDDVIDAATAMDACNLFADTTYRWPMTTTPIKSDSRSFLSGVSADDRDDGFGKSWDVRLEFAPADPTQDARGPVGEDGYRNPFLAPPTLRGWTEVVEFAPTRDRSGTPILNKAGDPFDPTPTTEESILTFEVTHVRPYYDPTTAGDYTNRVNGSEWLGWPAESLLLRNIGFERVWNADVGGVVWNLTWSFAFKKPIEVSSKIVYPGWKLVVLNAGYRELVAGEPKQIYINDDPATSPVPLASDGAKLASGADPVYLPFDMRPTADFNDFDFPSDLFSAGTAPPE